MAANRAHQNRININNDVSKFIFVLLFESVNRNEGFFVPNSVRMNKILTNII